MGLISPGGENLLDFLEFRQVLSTYDGDLRDPHWWPQERPGPMRVARRPLGGHSGFLSRRSWGLRPCVESVPEPEVSSPVLTWILGTSGVSQGSHSSSRVGTTTWVFLASCSSCVTLPFAWIMGSVAFPRGFPRRLSTRLSHRAVPHATVV